MPPSERLREEVIGRFGDVDLFLANFPSPPQSRLGRTFAPLLKVLRSPNEDLVFRRSASRAGIDLSTRNPTLRFEEGAVCVVLKDQMEDEEIRLNCGLILLNRTGRDRSRVLDEIEGLKQASDQWTRAVARVLLRSERNGELTPVDQLVAIAAHGAEEEIAAALFLLQLHGINEGAYGMAISRTRHSNTRIRIAAARLSLIQAVLRVAALGQHMADVFRPLATDRDAQVRAVVPALLALFLNDSPTVADITRLLEVDSDPLVLRAMNQRWVHGRFCEFFDSPILFETS